ncbi:MAG: DNA polymerase III [Treponema sp.]|jgi:DNA polymerase-3 subunit gamma/tau|nr:DNA polymerase III [Treponema sp.]
MFENILGQPVTEQLSRDIKASVLASSMLFSGPPASGKGTTALELGRILSCEAPPAPWSCSCPACSRHRLLLHPDLLLLGPRSFGAEIAAASAAFLREPENLAAGLLFIRSVRKLLARFSPLLWEDDVKKFKDISPLILQLEESLDDLEAWRNRVEGGANGGANGGAESGLEKINGAILKNAFKLEAEGIAETIPISQIRRAAYWSRLAPVGKRKLLLIENADRMQEGGRNALLKILEEPPERVCIVLASAQSRALLPTILSRLRPYRFFARDEDAEREVIRRVFRNAGMEEDASLSAPVGRGNRITAYLDSFLPVSDERLYALAACFTASLAYRGARALRNRKLPDVLVFLGKYTTSIAEAAGLERTGDAGAAVAQVLAGTENFDAPGLFSRFLKNILSLVSESLRSAPVSGGVPPEGISLAEAMKRLTAEAASAVGVYNQSPALALERCCAEFQRFVTEL